MSARPLPLPEPAIFALERFAWEAPDRLEVSGWFSGVYDAPSDPPVLVVRAGDQINRLSVVPDRRSATLQDGEHWSAAFAWRDAPEAFERADLEFGSELVVELPEPRPKRTRRGDRVLEVRRPLAEEEGGAPPAAKELALETALLVAQEDVRELRAAVERAHVELTATREDLEAERRRRAEDAERFREGLERVRGSAEAALARAAGHGARQRAEIGAARAEAEQLVARLAGLEDALAEQERT
jgi:hypothetical protein